MEMNIRDNWIRLGPDTRQWFTDNPGCLVVPRTIVAAINAQTNGTADCDGHGRATLPHEDRSFIRSRRGPSPGPEHVFHDAARP